MTSYNHFAHLYRSLFLGRADYMSMLTIYCDDSGTDHRNRVAVVAGYIGQVVKWERFSKDWKKILKKYGVAEMHRADLETFNGRFARDRGWNESRRKEFLQDLHPIINSYTRVPIGSAVIKKDFEAIVPEHLRRKFGGVYGWCIHECIVAVGKWCEKNGHRHSIDWVLEAGTIGHGQVDAMFRELYSDPNIRSQCHIKGWSFQNKSVTPLQAADVIAYECFKQVENQIVDGGEKRGVRLSMKHLMGSEDGTYLKYWSHERLVEWMGAWNRTWDKRFSPSACNMDIE